jgi:histidyl-tRNA synthetase
MTDDTTVDTPRRSGAQVRLTPISGFPEYPPDIQLILERRLGEIRNLFASYGYVPIDTPIVERLEVLSSKGGDVDKEMYALGRASVGDGTDNELGLRYDLTVPLARYVAFHFDKLVFPFKRYHIGDCWRGERPQDGRYRQFKQADVDVVTAGPLPLSFDADIPLLVNEAIRVMSVDDSIFRVSNRKILGGYLNGLGCSNHQVITRILDKIEKLGVDGVARALVDEVQLAPRLAERVLRIATITSSDLSFVEQVRALDIDHPLLSEGIAELTYVMTRVLGAQAAEFLVDLSITRGFDYYTGSVYEVRWNRHPGIGSIAAGGRYDDLSNNFTRQQLPGVGMSVGISRIFGKQVQTGDVSSERNTSTHALIVWDRADNESDLQALAAKLRGRGICVEVFHEPSKLAKQIKYADRKGIPYAIFPRFGEAKRMQTGEQFPFDVDSFVASVESEVK